MPDVVILRQKWTEDTSPYFEVLLQKRSGKVNLERFRWAFPGGDLNREDIDALRIATEVKKDESLVLQILRRAALREVLQMCGNGNCDGTNAVPVSLREVKGLLEARRCDHVGKPTCHSRLPKMFREQFDCNARISRHIPRSHTFIYLLHPKLEEAYIRNWEPDSHRMWNHLVDREEFTATTSCIWVPLEDVFQHPERPVNESKYGMVSWQKNIFEPSLVRKLARELSIQIFVPPDIDD